MLLALITKSLQPGDSGKYFVIFGSILSTYFICGIGATDGLIILAAKLRHQGDRSNLERSLASAVVFSLATAVLFGVFFMPFIWIITDSVIISIFSGIWWISYGIVYCMGQILIADERIKAGSFVFYASINVSSLIIVGMCFVSRVDLRLSEVIIAFSISSIVAAFGSILYVQRNLRVFGAQIEPASLKSSIKTGWVIAAGRIVQALILWMPIWTAAYFIGEAAAAEIGLASRLAFAVSAMLAAVKFSIRPRIAHYIVRRNWDVVSNIRRNVSKFSVTFVVIAMVLTVTIGQSVIPLIFGHSYSEVWLLLFIILLGALAESIAGPVDEMLKLSGFASFVALSQIIVLVFGFCVQALLSYYFTGIGVAFGHSVSFALLYSVIMLKFFKIRSI